MADLNCLRCRRLEEDLLEALIELSGLKNARFRGTIEFSLDGSGKIKGHKKTEKKAYISKNYP